MEARLQRQGAGSLAITKVDTNLGSQFACSTRLRSAKTLAPHLPHEPPLMPDVALSWVSDSFLYVWQQGQHPTHRLGWLPMLNGGMKDSHDGV